MHAPSHPLVGVLLLMAALTSACASTRQAGVVPVPRPFPGAPTPPLAASEPSTVDTSPFDSNTLVGTALGYRGTKYKFGGSDPRGGFDCSGFTQYVFGRHGVALPREVAEQYSTGTPVKPQELQPGDLIFFSTVAPGATHVAIAIGGDQFVHAPSSRGVVRVERLSSSYWAPRFLGARRIEAN